LHINCGTTCHNSNSNAVAYAPGMILRLDPAKLDGRSALELESMTTTIAVPGKSTTWNGRRRIIAGDAAGSLLFQLISRRGVANQMPPIATNLVDEVNDALIAAWIDKMPVSGAPDSGVNADAPTSDVDAASDNDAGSPDAGVVD
jgi:hypothetical protein